MFFVVALFGITHHEMWRDEHQAWLVARDAHSLPQLFQNLRYEGHPALWHLILYLITSFTSNPAAMQGFHLLIACAFIFVFNRYAEIETSLKLLFSFGYFSLYEYAVISRSYGLGVLLLFVACALYRNRRSNYVLIGICLALLANVSVYGLILSLGFTGILTLEYLFPREKGAALEVKFLSSLAIYATGAGLSLYQIWPDQQSTFPANLATSLFEAPRWILAASRLFVTYFYIPDFHGMHFWNTSLYFKDEFPLPTQFHDWFASNPVYLFWLIVMPAIVLLIGIMTFIQKPFVLLFYTSTTCALIILYYYTFLLYPRYCGYLLIILIASVWLAKYYPEKNYHHSLLRILSRAGRRARAPFLALVLSTNILGALVAYTKDYQFKFSPGKDAANYIRENKLDALTITGANDFVLSPLASYLNTRIFYQDMNDYGSFCIWNKKRNNNLTLHDRIDSLTHFMSQGRAECLLVWSTPLKTSKDGQTFTLVEHALINKNIKLDLVKRFEDGIVADETYYLYIVRQADPATEDLRAYKSLN